MENGSGIPLGWLLIIVLAALIFAAHPVKVFPQANFVDHVDSVGFTVSDLDKSLEFYTKVLPFEKVSEVEVAGDDYEHLSGVFGARVRIARLKLGDEYIELTEYLTPGGRAIPVDSRSNDKWFQHIAIIASDMDKAYAHLRANKVRHASTGPQTLPAYIKAAAGIKAFYFRDPDNHNLEILSFPPDKGAPKWHELEKTGKLFLGIDHTAIVVGDTDVSLKFYRDNLGLAVAGESENYGPEQEHLNNVFGARLHITGLKTKEPGINVEFLEYLAPQNGRPFPLDSKSSDLWHWQTSFSAKDADSIGNSLTKNKYSFISTGVVRLSDLKLGMGKATLVRDPDGHAVRITEN